ncbi:PREDICTED: uncharacterized protein LOC105957253 [Erythranthe guttata]|uniref:uncharacterized protein LOC105957253 n=1 Tax=Erythranthe guttata TaxID=4155 RepID=UPI00064DC89B|nr:PREDICTED: uncharacterized protein LOC105957253 [Erythranthe guttata]|eukprot:XP_012836638.1 PREDICTED: uncharacterized protein LOC105957253 [Erythranthe guttata]
MKRNDLFPDTRTTYKVKTELNQTNRSSENNVGIESSSISNRRDNNNHQQNSTTEVDPSIKKTKEDIARFFFENGLDFNSVSSPSFHNMMGPRKCHIPTLEELKGPLFQDALKEVTKYIDEARNSWAHTGCTILLDEWKGETGRDFVNVLVDSPRGTIYLSTYDISDYIGKIDKMKMLFDKVLSEVGVENVVQVITSSNSIFTKEVAKELSEKYRQIFWSVSGSFCMQLMLEKLLEIDVIKEILEKAKIFTRFIYGNPNALKYLKEKTNGRDLFQQCSKIKSTQPFLTLENIVLEKQILTKMFRSPIFLADKGWDEVYDLVSDESFWKGASDVLKAAIPLVRVIKWMTGISNKEHMGYIYETMDQAKKTIKQGLKTNKAQYTRFWKVIDEIWSGVLFTPIHAAGYYLNPNLFYTSDRFIDPEVATSLLCCVVRTTRDPRVQDRVTMQIETYQNAKGAFGLGCAEDQRSNTSPGSINFVLIYINTYITIV